MARTNESGLTPQVIQGFKNKTNPVTGKRYTEAEIARMYNVTRQYVNWIKKNYRGVSELPREYVRRMFPWQGIPHRFHLAQLNQRLRDHGIWISGNHKELSRDRTVLLRGFYNTLESLDAVVEYDPDIPPSPENSFGGWALRERLDTDGDLIVRWNHYAREITSEDRKVWRMPPDRP